MNRLRLGLAVAAASITSLAAAPANAGYVEIYEDAWGYQVGGILYCEDYATVISGFPLDPSWRLRTVFWIDTWEQYGC